MHQEVIRYNVKVVPLFTTSTNIYFIELYETYPKIYLNLYNFLSLKCLCHGEVVLFLPILVVYDGKVACYILPYRQTIVDQPVTN